MILHNDDSDERLDAPVLAATCGARCTSVELNAKDFRDLAQLQPAVLHDWLTTLQTRFKPT